MTKIKSEPLDESKDVKVKLEEDTYEYKLRFVNEIAKPMASKKLTKKCYKLVKKAAQHKTFLRNGLKDVQTRLRKGETGIVIFAGDVKPIEIMCHLPAICEEKAIPYVYVPSRADLGAAMGIKRGTVSVLVREHLDYKELYDEIATEISTLPMSL